MFTTMTAVASIMGGNSIGSSISMNMKSILHNNYKYSNLINQRGAGFHLSSFVVHASSVPTGRSISLSSVSRMAFRKYHQLLTPNHRHHCGRNNPCRYSSHWSPLQLYVHDHNDEDIYGTNNTKNSSINSNSSLWTAIHRGGALQRRQYSTDGKNNNNNNRQNGQNSTTVTHMDDGSSTKMRSRSSSSSSSSLSSSSPQRNRMMKRVRTSIGNVFSAVAFVTSSTMSLFTNRNSFNDQFNVPLEALQTFLEKSGVDIELSRAMNRRLGTNIGLLGRANMFQIQHDMLSSGRNQQNTHKQKTKTKKISDNNKSILSPQFLLEAQRYMRYATACYGRAMIHAAEVDARGVVDMDPGKVTKDVVGNHISVPPNDIVRMDIDYDASTDYLRHMVVVDHTNRKVVLALRGTFSLQEIVVDVAGFSRSFCGGEAHCEMANNAEKVWKIAGPTVLETLESNKGYELIVTGHSLGAGAACLLTVFLESKGLLPKSQNMRCFAYASPPVFTPLEFVPKAGSKITNFIHQNDVVPFLSVDSVRHLFQDLSAVDEFSCKDMTRSDRYKVILGVKDVPADLVGAVIESEGKALEPKEGAPPLFIPSAQNVWLTCEDESEEGEYTCDVVSSRSLQQRGIKVHPEMFLDHFPSRYEHAFDHMLIKDDD